MLQQQLDMIKTKKGYTDLKIDLLKRVAILQDMLRDKFHVEQLLKYRPIYKDIN